jgi:hypothetical protein
VFVGVGLFVCVVCGVRGCELTILYMCFSFPHLTTTSVLVLVVIVIVVVVLIGVLVVVLVVVVVVVVVLVVVDTALV